MTPGTLSVQLYTFRDAYAQNPEKTMARVADLGFRYVEPFGVGSHSLSNADKLARAKELRALLDQHGLKASSAHVAAPIGPDVDAVLDALETLGCRLVVISWPGEVPGFERTVMDTREGTERFAAALNEAAANAAKRGLELGYHNHWWEWGDNDGQYAYDRLLNLLDPGVALEVDAYWAHTGGQDVPALLRRLGGRVQALHIKDGPATPEADQVPLGGGVVDNAAAIKAAPSARWHVMEMDRTAGDVFTEIRQGAEKLVQEGLSAWQ